jgi:hypothetical protein
MKHVRRNRALAAAVVGDVVDSVEAVVGAVAVVVVESAIAGNPIA